MGRWVKGTRAVEVEEAAAQGAEGGEGGEGSLFEALEEGMAS